jgi:hypothetical protein
VSSSVQTRVTNKQKHKTTTKKTQAALGWQSGSSGRAPALQEQSPEFKTQCHKKKKNTLCIISFRILIAMLIIKSRKYIKP